MRPHEHVDEQRDSKTLHQYILERNKFEGRGGEHFEDTTKNWTFYCSLLTVKTKYMNGQEVEINRKWDIGQKVEI